MSNTLITIAIITFVALAILIEHRLNRRRRDKEKQVVTDILQDAKKDLGNSINDELSPTATGRIQARDMLDRTKPHDKNDSKAQSSTANSAIKDTLVEQELEEPPLPDPFAVEDKTKR